MRAVAPCEISFAEAKKLLDGSESSCREALSADRAPVILSHALNQPIAVIPNQSVIGIVMGDEAAKAALEATRMTRSALSQASLKSLSEIKFAFAPTSVTLDFAKPKKGVLFAIYFKPDPIGPSLVLANKSLAVVLTTATLVVTYCMPVPKSSLVCR